MHVMGASNVRSLITGLTPPLLLGAAQRQWHRARGLGSHTFDGSYPTLADVPCGEGTYDDDEIAQMVVESAERLLEAVGTPKDVIDKSGNLILPMFASNFIDQKLTVLDFGGGPALGLFSLLNHVPGLNLAKLTYFIVETRAVCRAFRASIKPTIVNKLGAVVHIDVAEDIPAATGSPLIVNAASVIHLIADYRQALSRLAALAPEIFIVSQTPMSEQPTYARQQLNIPRKKVAQWVFNRADFLSEMKRLGYVAIFAIDHDLPVTHKNAPGPSTVTSMVFRPI
jgi:putative methyltransferase (TIGR04325 family)